MIAWDHLAFLRGAALRDRLVVHHPRRPERGLIDDEVWLPVVIRTSIARDERVVRILHGRHLRRVRHRTSDEEGDDGCGGYPACWGHGRDSCMGVERHRL